MLTIPKRPARRPRTAIEEIIRNDRLAGRRWILVVGLMTALLLSAASLHAEPGWTLRLERHPEREWRAPDDALRIHLEGTPPTGLSDRLRLEVDAVDVTDLSRIDERILLFDPPEPLQPGEHTLRVIDFEENGEITERGVWNFEVRESAAFRRRSLTPTGEVSLTSRVSERNLDPPSPAQQAQASLRLEGKLANAAYEVSAETSMVADTSLEQDEVQLYDFLLRAGNERVNVQLGQHAVEGRTLIRDNFLRRGLSLGLTAKHLSLTAYAQRTDTVAGFGDLSGLEERDRLTTGVTARLSPLPGDPQRLILSAGLLRGRGSEEGVAEFGDGEIDGSGPAGDAWQVGMDGNFLQGRLRLFGEFARSDYDFDGAGTAFATRQDDAFNLLLQYASAGRSTFDWNAALQLREVGTGFRSIANAALPNDKRVLDGTLAFSRGSLNGNMQVGMERDNLDRRRDFPTIESRVLRIDLAWSPTPPEQSPGGLRGMLFANPWYQLAYAQIDNRQVNDAPLYLGETTDNVNRDLMLSAGFSPGNWSWSFDFQANRFDEKRGILAGTRSDLLGVTLDLPVTKRIRLATSIQSGRGEDRSSGVDTSDLTASLSTSFMYERFATALDYSYGRSKASDGTYDVETQVLGLSLNYGLLTARNRRPGVDLFLAATWSDSDDAALPGPNPLSRQIFVGVRSNLTPGGGY